MLSELSDKISCYFVRSNLIRQEDHAMYSYSVEVLLATLLNTAMLYMIALLTGKVWETTMFIAGFVPLRSLAGGYHAKTHFRCMITLLVTYLGFLAIINLISKDQYMFVSIAFVSLSVVLVWLLSPVEDRNKPLSAAEKKMFRRRSRFTIIIYACVVVFASFVLLQRVESLCIAIGAMSVSLSLAAAYYGNKRIVNPASETQ